MIFLHIGFVVSSLIAAISYSRVLAYLERSHPVLWIDLRRTVSPLRVFPFAYARFMLLQQFADLWAVRDSRLLLLSAIALISGWACIAAFAAVLIGSL
jgi:hypothetical protein